MTGGGNVVAEYYDFNITLNFCNRGAILLGKTDKSMQIISDTAT